MRINELRAKHIYETVEIVGEVCYVGERDMMVVGILFECQNCGTLINKSYRLNDKKITSPEKCSCGNKTKFTIIKKDIIDIRKIKIKEFDKILGISLPMVIWLIGELSDFNENNLLKKGIKIRVIGRVNLSSLEENNSYNLEATKFEIL